MAAMRKRWTVRRRRKLARSPMTVCAWCLFLFIGVGIANERYKRLLQQTQTINLLQERFVIVIDCLCMEEAHWQQCFFFHFPFCNVFVCNGQRRFLKIKTKTLQLKPEPAQLPSVDVRWGANDISISPVVPLIWFDHNVSPPSLSNPLWVNYTSYYKLIPLPFFLTKLIPPSPLHYIFTLHYLFYITQTIQS